MPDQNFTAFHTPVPARIKFNGDNNKIKTSGQKAVAADLLNRPKVLMYHRIVDETSLSQTQSTCVHINEFHKHLELIDHLGYTPITFDDYRLYQSGELRLPRKPIIITFDDGYLDTYRLAFPLLREYGMKAVVFVLGDPSIRSNIWDADQPGISKASLMNRDQISDLYNSGFEIGVHTLSHSKLVHLSDEKCLHEIQRPKIIMEAVIGSNIYSFSYPYGQVNKRIKNLVAESGYKYACSVFSGPPKFGSDLFEIRRITVHNNTSLAGFALRLMGPYEYLEWMWWKLRKGNT